MEHLLCAGHDAKCCTCVISPNHGNGLANYSYLTDEMRLREVNVLPTVTELVSGRDVIVVPGWFVCLRSPLPKLVPRTVAGGEDTASGVREIWLA